jgi:hypothetical protein
VTVYFIGLLSENQSGNQIMELICHIYYTYVVIALCFEFVRVCIKLRYDALQLLEVTNTYINTYNSYRHSFTLNKTHTEFFSVY